MRQVSIFKRLVLKFVIVILFLFSSIHSIVSQIDNQDKYLTIDEIAYKLEQKKPVQFFYKSEWFENTSFLASISELPFNEALNQIIVISKLSVITIDSVLYLFVPVTPEINNPTQNIKPDVLVIGNSNEYGKYSKANIRGKILDGKDGKPLPAVSVFIDKLNTGTTTNKDGEYRLQIPVGEYSIKMSFIGYEDNLQKIKLVSDGALDLKLYEDAEKLNEVVISGRAESNVSETQMSVIKLDSKTIKELPMTMGGIDIIKSITLMPGIQTIGEFGTGFNVRGGSADQNLILIEDEPLFNLSHLFGLISVVNSDGISNVTLLKAGISAKYGERASSVMDIEMGANNPEKTTVKGGIGIINSSLYIETPLFNKKFNLQIGGRTSYVNWFLHSMPDIDLKHSSARFYDANALLSYNLNQNNKISLFVYSSNDFFAFAKNTDYKYSNLLGSVRWKHTFNQVLYFNLVGGLSDYHFQVSESDTARAWDAYKINSALHYKNVKWNFSWFPNEKNALDFGINTAFYKINPGELNPLFGESSIEPIQIQAEKAVENAIYITDNIKFSPRFALDLGVRYSFYTFLGPNKIYSYDPNLSKAPKSITDSVIYGNNQPICSYSGFEPRISMRYTVTGNSSVKMSYNRIHQYVNLISNTAVMAPSDVWKLSSPNLKPLTCDHFAIGYFMNFKRNTYETSVEIYYKNLLNAIDYKNGAKILLNPYLEADLTNVRGQNYGIELFIKKNIGNLTGWLSYTYSRSLQKTNSNFSEDKIKENQSFPSSFDRPNNLVLNANYHISKRWRFGGTFSYSTGRPVTLPELKFNYQGYQMIYYSNRNKFRMPDYHRLDISITLDESISLKKKWKGSWTFSVINVYGRNNAYSVFYKKEDHLVNDTYKKYDTYKLYIIGMPLPTLTYNFTF